MIQQAAYDHVGYVLEQEGDSFTLAFHEPQDAVEFALQVSVGGWVKVDQGHGHGVHVVVEVGGWVVVRVEGVQATGACTGAFTHHQWAAGGHPCELPAEKALQQGTGLLLLLVPFVLSAC